jgi:hypothetical protein
MGKLDFEQRLVPVLRIEQALCQSQAVTRNSMTFFDNCIDGGSTIYIFASASSVRPDAIRRSVTKFVTTASSHRYQGTLGRDRA